MEDEKIYKILKKISENKEFSDEMEKVSPGIKAQMAGIMCRSWLPFGTTRKVIMAMIVLIALIGTILFDKRWLLILLIACTFSPRIMGEFLSVLGLISRFLFGTSKK